MRQYHDHVIQECPYLKIYRTSPNFIENLELIQQKKTNKKQKQNWEGGFSELSECLEYKTGHGGFIFPLHLITSFKLLLPFEVLHIP